MDTYETLNKSSSFDSIGKFGILTGLKNEPCNLDKDEIQSTKPLKYFTENFFDKTVIQNRGIFFQDGFGVPSGEIDTNTKTRFGIMTNNNLIQNLPGLPLPAHDVDFFIGPHFFRHSIAERFTYCLRFG